jgi:folate-dependent phosphoribosylglycinamide formyltransferase PurN
MKKVVLITTAFAEDWPVIRALSSESDSVIFRPRNKNIGSHSLWARIRRAQIQARVNRRCNHRWTTPSLEDSGIRYFDIDSRKISDLETEKKIEDENPDYLFVCGGPILKSNIFTIPKIAAINLHWGIAPNMRGAESSFWSLYKGNWKGIGMTLHKLDTGIDRGAHLAKGCPALTPWDNEVTCWKKNSEIAIQLLKLILETPEEKIRDGGKVPSEKGNNYCYSDHKWWHDLAFVLRRWLLFHRPPKTNKETWHYL